MIKKITDFFNNVHQQALEQEQVEIVTLQMACVVLLCEVMRADGKMTTSEQTHLASIIKSHFHLTIEQASDLIDKACHLSEQSIDFHQFTSKINQHYHVREKTKMVSLLWQLALADGELASIEEHFIRRIGDLLHLSRAEYIQAKNTVISPNFSNKHKV